jgi:hypothetical protein
VAVVMPSKKPVPGVDFAPPEPIASVLPRIQLTGCQAEKLLALVRKGRRCNPISDEEAAIAKEIFEAAELKKEVEWALKFYVRDVLFRMMSLSSVVVLRHFATALMDFSPRCHMKTIRSAIFSSWGNRPASLLIAEN